MSSPIEDARSDSQLVAALNGGDRSAFDALYHRHRDWVARLARRFTGSDDDALDVLQDTFAYLFRKFPGFILTARMTTFLYPVVRNLSIASRKKRDRTRREAAGDLDAAPAPPPAPGDPSDLAIVMQSLPEIQREVLLMRFVDGMTLQEIAVALRIPEGTVKSRMHNAIAALKSDWRVKKHFFEV